MEEKYTEDSAFKTAQKRVKDIKGFYIHLLVYLFVNIAIMVVQIKGKNMWEELQDITNYSTVFFWGIGLVAHWAGVFGSGLILGRRWEERKIKEIMDKEMQEKRKWE
ncbi:MAG TPA: 2TM domain-containing protein [Gillisia sp.]|nr:2TM domain-containing protein [Gillisia sp.]